MEIIVTTLEIIGAIAFAVSGALVGIRKNMDVFGVCVLGLSTAVGGGVIRDLDVYKRQLTDIAGGAIPCEHLWRAVSGVLPPCVPVLGQKIKTFSGEQIMSKRTRQYIGILAALAAYYLVHEGAHLLYALFTGVLKQINFMGLGVQIDVYAEHMTNMQLGIFCLVGALATFCIGYLLAALARSICRRCV